MLVAIIVLIVALALAFAYAFWQSNKRLELERERVIRSYVFPPGVMESFRNNHPFLDTKGAQLVA